MIDWLPAWIGSPSNTKVEVSVVVITFVELKVGLAITLNSISPLYEAFNDRVAGWVANITVNTQATLDFCNFPKL